MAGNVAFLGMLLTGVAMLGVLISRARRHDIRWKTSIVFGAIAAGLLLLHQLNTLPLELYGYDTTHSWCASSFPPVAFRWISQMPFESGTVQVNESPPVSSRTFLFTFLEKLRG